jgi:hypothetical protein
MPGRDHPGTSDITIKPTSVKAGKELCKRAHYSDNDFRCNKKDPVIQEKIAFSGAQATGNAIFIRNPG